jgi:alkanesulfonate monooxygenase SsuD/methylene tetrahydromethanopterin reductase-like flavin-dependent oxidoreductase (luciferase family)
VHHDLTLRRITKWGDGWMMNAYPAGASAQADFAKLRAYAEQAARDPASIGVEVWISTGAGDEASWRTNSSSGRARASLTSRSTAPLTETTTGASPRAHYRPI